MGGGAVVNGNGRPLSAVVDDVARGEPAVITRHGKPEAVIRSFEEWGRLSQVPSFGRLLMVAPVRPGDLPERDRTPLRIAISEHGVSGRYQRGFGRRTGLAGGPDLLAWMDAHAALLFLSTIAVAEIEHGIARLRREGRHTKATTWQRGWKPSCI